MHAHTRSHTTYTRTCSPARTRHVCNRLTTVRQTSSSVKLGVRMCFKWFEQTSERKIKKIIGFPLRSTKLLLIYHLLGSFVQCRKRLTCSTRGRVVFGRRRRKRRLSFLRPFLSTHRRMCRRAQEIFLHQGSWLRSSSGHVCGCTHREDNKDVGSLFAIAFAREFHRNRASMVWQNLITRSTLVFVRWSFGMRLMKVLIIRSFH